MAETDDDDTKLLAMGISCLIVLIGWAIGAALTIRFLNRRVRRLEEQAAAPARSDSMAPLYYVMSLFFWPASLGFTIHFLRSAERARIGRLCGVLGIVQISALVLLTCAGMFALAWYRPDLLP